VTKNVSKINRTNVC